MVPSIIKLTSTLADGNSKRSLTAQPLSLVRLLVARWPANLTAARMASGLRLRAGLKSKLIRQEVSDFVCDTLGLRIRHLL